MIRIVQRRPRVVPVSGATSRRTVRTEVVARDVATTSSTTRQPSPAVGPNFVGREREQLLYDELALAQPGDLDACERLIAVLVPVLSRPHRVAPLLESFRRATSDDDAALYFVAQRSDHEELEAISSCGEAPILVDDADRSWAKKINRGFSATSEPWLLLGADDLSFYRGWVDSVRGLLRTHPGVIGTNDLGNSSTMTGKSSTHPLVRRSYATVLGTADERGKVLHEGYDHNFPDSELVQTAKTRGLYVHERRCVIEHLHPLWGKGQHDPIYQLGQRNWDADQALFVQRCRAFGIGVA